MSATSSLGRRRAAGSGLGSWSPLGERPEPVEWAHHPADRGGGDPGVERRGVELGVPQQDLDHADVDVLLEEVGGEAVPERVRRHPLLDLGHVGGSMAGAIELTCGQRQQRIAAREQPGLRPCDAIPVAQQLEQLG
jgi:hypothetical protein